MLFTDQIGHTFELASTPKRIISLVPSQTELLHYLGLNNEVVGVTKFCIHPNSWFKSKQRVGGTKKLNLDKIKNLKPDLIVANKEENTKEEIETLEQLYPVYTSNILNLGDALQMISDLGIIMNKKEITQQLIHAIEQNFKSVPPHTSNKKPSVLYLIWNQPMIGVGKETFIHDMIHQAGFQNVISTSRYPEMSVENIQLLNPDFIFLSSEPFPFKEKHQQEFQEKFPNQKVVLVDGELFSWYGNRLLKSSEYFSTLRTLLS